MGKKRILIVEDESQVALALCRSLEFPIPRRYEVEISPVAETAMAKLCARTYDLIVTDLSLPGMSGLQFLRHVREANPQARTMLITAYGSSEIEDLATELGAVYLAKPFSVHRFAAVVERILEGPECYLGRLSRLSGADSQAPGSNGSGASTVRSTNGPSRAEAMKS
jgi:two-component system response regulator (stage 0 sporulation protein F)